MSSIMFSPDFTTLVTNIGVFLAASGAVVAAIWSAAKKADIFETSKKDNAVERVIGGHIMDNTTLMMWAESNRGVIDALRDHQREMAELRFALVQLKEAVK